MKRQMTYQERNSKTKESLDPAMQHKVSQLEEEGLLLGMDWLYPPDGGRRTSDRQDELYSDPRGVTGVNDSNSFHVHGVAVDIVPVGMFGRLKWNDHNYHERIARIAVKMGFEWGYQMWGWDSHHFQYTQGLTIEDFKSGKKLDLKQAVSERIHALDSRIQRVADVAEKTKNPIRKIRANNWLRVNRRKVARLRKLAV